MNLQEPCTFCTVSHGLLFLKFCLHWHILLTFKKTQIPIELVFTSAGQCHWQSAGFQKERSRVQVLALNLWNIMNLHFHDSMVYLCSLILLISYASYSYLIPSYRCLQLYYYNYYRPQLSRKQQSQLNRAVGFRETWQYGRGGCHIALN